MPAAGRAVEPTVEQAVAPAASSVLSWRLHRTSRGTNRSRLSARLIGLNASLRANPPCARYSSVSSTVLPSRGYAIPFFLRLSLSAVRHIFHK